MGNARFKPGDQVLTTGIYTATHHQHRRAHEVLAVKGERFPNCKKCGTSVSFDLLHAAGPIELDRDFVKTDGAGPKKIQRKRQGN
ncbi:MAG TPA: hypothetical protein VHA33_02550 [Candidatus Angelobacter sp.]|jgi:hypothetical protein|nr:hypothetical protein [Candidatus Angelobacter sp.]